MLIVHYNTPELTKATVLSVWKHTQNAKVFVFDNSTEKPFVSMDGVILIDNTEGKILDFDKMIHSFPNRQESTNGYGSAKHCYTVDHCFEYFDEGFVLLDSDVLVKKDLTDLFDSSVCWVGEKHTTTKHPVRIPRLYPFCCFINTKMCSRNRIRYFDAYHMWQLSGSKLGCWYDTGAWFLEASKDLPHRQIRVSDYVEHYGGGSFLTDKKISPEEWLNKYVEYYE